MSTTSVYQCVYAIAASIALTLVASVATAVVLPETIDLAEAPGTEGTPFTRAFGGAGYGMTTGNQGVAEADFNGDGYDDYVVAFASYGPEGALDKRRGRVVIVYGGETPLTVDLGDPAGKSFITCTDDFAEFGYSVAAGDLDGDGLPDLIVGAPGALENKGAVLLFFNPDLQPGASHSVNTNQPASSSVETRYLGVDEAGQLGYSVLAANLNPNAAFEVVAGAPSATANAQPQAGKVYVLFGATRTVGGTLLVTDDSEQWEIQGAADSGLGNSLASGDFDGDGIVDLALGAPAFSGATGRVYLLTSVYPGPTMFDLADANNFPAVARLDGFLRLGQSMAVGDLNDDGKEDLLMGMPLHAPGGLTAAGGAVLMAGRDNLIGNLFDLNNNVNGSILRIEGVAEQEFAGYSVALGDLDGDGKEDICIGAPFADAADASVGSYGRTTIFTGLAVPVSYLVWSMNLGPLVWIHGASDASFLGASIAALGDINRDGYADLITTAAFEANPGEDGEGSANILYGDGTALGGTAVKLQQSGPTTLDALGGPLSPVLRTRVEFNGGSGGLVSATITRNTATIENLGNGLGTNIAPVYWNLSTDRTAWTLATIELQYTDGEIAAFNEGDLAVYQAPAVDGPWTLAATQTQDADSNLFTIESDSLGYFALVSNAPVITLIGDIESVRECIQVAFDDPGYTATAADGTDLTDQVVIGGDTVSLGAPGEYVITYDVEDGLGNPAATATRTVLVEDTQPPGFDGDVIDASECGSPFNPAALSGVAYDACWGDITDLVVADISQIDTSATGEWPITLNVTDPSGNVASEFNTNVAVVDFIDPTITLKGDNPMVIPCFSEFVDPGVTVTDNCDDPETLTVDIAGEIVNTEIVDTYTIFYDVRDSSGNFSETISRDVQVVGFCGFNGTGDDCPNDSVFNQQPESTPFTSFVNNTSTMFETFHNPQSVPIGEIIWWGRGVGPSGESTCDLSAVDIAISFYDTTATLDGPRPDSLLGEYIVTPLIQDAGFTDTQGFAVQRFTAVLDPPVVFDPQTQDVVRILSIRGQDDSVCRLGWASSGLGDSEYLRSIQGVFSVVPGVDLAMCLLPETADTDGEGEGSPDGEGAVDGEGEGDTDGEGDADGEGEGEGASPASAYDTLLGLYDADTSMDGKLDLSEFTAAFSLDEDPFNALDTNGDGFLSPSELQRQIPGVKPIHNADLNGDGQMTLSEVVRVIQLYNAGGYTCAVDPEDSDDGFEPVGAKGGLPLGCVPHAGDYQITPDGVISLSELLRLIQFYSLGDIIVCDTAEDGFCPVT